MNSNGHHWSLKAYVKYISRGTCDCGAIKFFANDCSEESLKLAEDYNKSEGKEGSGHMVTQNESLKSEEPAAATEEVVVRGREWYQAHKKEMIEDLTTMGYDAFLEKWKVKRQIVSHLKSDKLYKSRVAKAEVPAEMGRKSKHSEVESPKPAPAQTKLNLEYLGTYEVQEDKGMPDFPAFNEGWSDYVKVNWFETYQALKELEVKQ